MTSQPPISPLFPYTTLFRSQHAGDLPKMLRSSGDFRNLSRPKINRGVETDDRRGARKGRCRSWLQRKSRPEIFGNADRKSTRLNSSHRCISYAVFCLKKKKK